MDRMTQTTGKPEIGADGKIPCECCNHKGLRHRMGTLGKNKEWYTCNYCAGTKRRVPPIGYMPQSEIDKLPVEPEYMRYTEGVCEDGVAILCDGEPMTVTKILERLNQ